MPDRALVYNDDGWSSLMRYPAPLTPADLVRVTGAVLADIAR